MTIYKGGESNKTLTSFQQRKLYKENAKLGNARLFDTWYENPLAAKFNEDFEAVYLDSGIDETGVASMEPINEKVKVPSFLRTAFFNFREEYQTIVANTNIGYPIFLEDLTPVKGHIRFDGEYNDYLEFITTVAASFAKDSEERGTLTYQDFENKIITYMLAQKVRYPITNSGFLVSDRCPINVTGMVIELSDLPYNLDRDKGKIIQDESFKCYYSFSTRHGLIPDKNAPWRLHVNLQSDTMRKYITGPNSARDYKDYLNRFHRSKPAFDDLYSFYNFMTTAYSRYLDKDRIEIVSNWPQYGPTVEQMVPSFVKVRMLEIGASLVGLDEKINKVLDYHKVYSVRYNSIGKDRFLPVLSMVQKMTSDHYRNIFKNRNIDSYQPTFLKDYR
jgi:hypothetical protein